MDMPSNDIHIYCNRLKEYVHTLKGTKLDGAQGFSPGCFLLDEFLARSAWDAPV